MKKYFDNINFLQISIHFAATWFMIFATKTFSLLYEVEIFEALRTNGVTNLEEIGKTTYEFSTFLIVLQLSGFFGILTAFLISLVISKKKKYSLVNSYIVFILAFILYRFKLLGWEYLKQIFLLPGEIFTNPYLNILINGVILLSTSLLLFFTNTTNRIIEQNCNK